MGSVHQRHMVIGLGILGWLEEGFFDEELMHDNIVESDIWSFLANFWLTPSLWTVSRRMRVHLGGLE